MYPSWSWNCEQTVLIQPHHTLIRYTTHLASIEIWQIQSKWQPLVLFQESWMNQWESCIQSMVISFIVSFIQTIATPNYNSFRYYNIISCSIGLPSWKHRWVHGVNIRLFYYNKDYSMILYCIDAYLRRFRKLFMFSKKFNNRDFLAANTWSQHKIILL